MSLPELQHISQFENRTFSRACERRPMSVLTNHRRCDRLGGGGGQRSRREVVVVVVGEGSGPERCAPQVTALSSDRVAAPGLFPDTNPNRTTNRPRPAAMPRDAAGGRAAGGRRACKSRERSRRQNKNNIP